MEASKLKFLSIKESHNVNFLISSVFCHLCSLFDYEKIADRITDNTAKKLEKEKQYLHLVGTGGGMMDDIKMMAMSFYFYHEVDLMKQEINCVYSVEEYLSAIN